MTFFKLFVIVWAFRTGMVALPPMNFEDRVECEKAGAVFTEKEGQLHVHAFCVKVERVK